MEYSDKWLDDSIGAEIANRKETERKRLHARKIQAINDLLSKAELEETERQKEEQRKISREKLAEILVRDIAAAHSKLVELKVPKNSGRVRIGSSRKEEDVRVDRGKILNRYFPKNKVVTKTVNQYQQFWYLGGYITSENLTRVPTSDTGNSWLSKEYPGGFDTSFLPGPSPSNTRKIAGYCLLLSSNGSIMRLNGSAEGGSATAFDFIASPTGLPLIATATDLVPDIYLNEHPVLSNSPIDNPIIQEMRARLTSLITQHLDGNN